MSKVIYYNTKRPLLCKWFCIVSPIVGVAVFVALVLFDLGDFFVFMAQTCIIMPAILVSRISCAVTVDEEAGTIFNGENKENPMPIAQISYMTVKRTEKGKVRALFLRGEGNKFMEIRMGQPQIEAISGHLQKLNPSIEVWQGKYYF